jgi:hypothetical protein
MIDSNSVYPLHPLFSSRALVHGLFLPRSINVIVGDTKSGRMRLALTHFNTYADPSSRLFLDRAVTRPVQLGCILCSRPPERTLNDIEGMNLSHLDLAGMFPIERWNASQVDRADRENRIRSLEAVYTQFDHPDEDGNPKTRNGLPRFLLIENLIALSGSNRATDEEKIAIFLDQLREFCEKNECTILATVGTPKAKKGEWYPSITQRIRGSAMWGEGVDTIIAVEEVQPTLLNGLTADSAPSYRKIYLKPSSQPEITRWARFEDSGRLVLTDEPQTTTLTGQDILDRQLLQIPPGEAIRPALFYSWGMKADISERTIRRWITTCTDYDLLRKEGNGPATIYRRPADN